MSKISDMDKLVTSIKYCEGLAYYEKILENIFELNNSPLEIDFECIGYAKLAFLNNIFLATKDKTVQNNKSKMYIDEFEKTVLLIACKQNDGFIFADRFFTSAEAIVTFIRNAIAHGRYSLDEKFENIIIQDDEGLIFVNMDLLIDFVIELFQKRLILPLGSQLKKNFVFYSGDYKKIDTEDDIAKILEDFVIVEFSLENTDNDTINKENYKIFNIICEIAFSNPQFNFSCFLGNDELSTKRSCLSHEDISYLTPFLSNTLNKKDSFSKKIDALKREVKRFVDYEDNVNNIVSANITNLKVLSLLEKKSPKNIYELIDFINDFAMSSGNVLEFGYNAFVTVSMALFNSLFSYNLDRNFKNKCEDEFLGFDYSSLDLSCFNVKKYHDAYVGKIMKELNDLDDEMLQLENLIEYSFGKIEARNKDKEKTNDKGIKELEKAILSIENNIYEYLEEIELIKKRKLTKVTSYFENMDSIVAESLIEGIRNSIAHGNYKIEVGNHFGDSKIVFKDIYEGKLTFEASANIFDFLTFLYDSENKIYINEGVKEYARKLE